MPKKKSQIAPQEQSARFLQAAAEIEADGGASPEEAAQKIEKILARATKHAVSIDRSVKP